MNGRISSILFLVIGSQLPVPAYSVSQDAGERWMDLVRDGRCLATLVVPDDPAPIWADAIRQVSGPVQRWGGTPLRVVRFASDAPLPAGDVILLGTSQTSQAIAELADNTSSLVSRIPFTDGDGFAAESRHRGESRLLVLAGHGPRGAFNAAVLCRDFLLDATPAQHGRADAFLRNAAIVRSPAMAMRGTYCLSIYGVAMKHTAEDWKRIIDRHAEDGMNLICFWLSGHHPSRKFPQLYNVDSTKGTKLTVDGVTDLIRYCHNRGIRFYIGGGVFAWTASHYLTDGHPEIQALKAGGICPSKPYARQANREHFLEMYRTWPEADGFMLEVRDEHGECRCEQCQKVIDAFGSREYGRAEITWLQELAREAWSLNPKLHFCWLVGYAEHAHDVYYYDQIRRMNDPRFEWLDVRVGLDPNGKWVLPGPDGQPRPFAFFSRQIAHWDPFYARPIEHLVHWANRIADEGLYGYIPAFEPGFSSASYYSDQIPFPVNQLPYALTGLVYRELTWDPGISLDEIKKRVHRGFFSAKAPVRCTDDLIWLRQFSISHWQPLVAYGRIRLGYGGEQIPRLTVDGELKRVQTIADPQQRKTAAVALLKDLDVLAAMPSQLARMAEIETAMSAQLPQASPKTRDGLDLMRRMIEDTRAIYTQAVPDPRALTAAVAALEAINR